MIRERIEAYRSKTRKLPEHILFYRDGVSENQFGMVRDEELPQVTQACREAAGGGQKPKVTLVIVVKRHHGRFYSDVVKDEYNLRSGLLVDARVVAPKQFNFYLQAHDSPIGTARNAHYVVLENESGYNGAELQEIVSISPSQQR